MDRNVNKAFTLQKDERESIIRTSITTKRLVILLKVLTCLHILILLLQIDQYCIAFFSEIQKSDVNLLDWRVNEQCYLLLSTSILIWNYTQIFAVGYSMQFEKLHHLDGYASQAEYAASERQGRGKLPESNWFYLRLKLK